jgi:hypothetical protein
LRGPRYSVRRRFEQHGGYELVAWVDGTDPEDAWRLTQNGVSSVSWSRLPPPRVHPVGDGVGDGVVAVPVGGRFGRRSSDMGDVVMGEGGGIWRVAMFGFVSLEPCSVPEVPAPVRRETDPGGKRLHWTMEEQTRIFGRAARVAASEGAQAGRAAQIAREIATMAGMPAGYWDIMAEAAEAELAMLREAAGAGRSGHLLRPRKA